MFRNYGDINRTATSKEQAQSQAGETATYQCDFCSDGWQSETEVHIHREQVHKQEIDKMLMDDKTPLCVICVRREPSVKSLIKHIKTDHLLSSATGTRVEREIFVCHSCSQIFFNKAMLEIHLVMVHTSQSNTYKMQCPKCSKLIKRRHAWSHFEHHQIQSIASCPICLTKCRSRKHLKEHLTTHPGHYYCEMCRFYTKKLLQFHSHVQTHESEDKFDILDDKSLQRYFIPRRMDKSGWRYSRISSFKGLNLPIAIQICVLCRHICTNQQEIKQHIFNHSKQIPPIENTEKRNKFVCSCGKSFSVNVLLKHHLFNFKGNHRALGENEIPENVCDEDVVGDDGVVGDEDAVGDEDDSKLMTIIHIQN